MVKAWLKTWMWLLLLLPASLVCAAANPDWTTPIAPFRIADNLYYVGSKDLASYLVVTPKGRHSYQLQPGELASTHPEKRGTAWVSLQRH